MEETVQPQTTLRETLEANVELAEAGTLPSAEQRARDDAGRFAKKEETPVVQEAPKPSITTWRKEYLPLQDKLAQGIPLTPEEAKKLADYNIQRENDYKTGVSTYKTEASKAAELYEAINPFMGELQSRGMAPAQWIRDLGQAHYVLVKGTPDQKLQLIQTLARQYNVPLGAPQQPSGGVHPIVAQLMEKIQQLESQVGGVANWKQQAELQAIQHEIQKTQGDAQTYPHFDAVREDMAQLLEKGAATDLPMAYKMAVRFRDDLFEEEVNRRSQQTTKTNVVQKARAQAVSPKSSTPSGQVTTSTAKDRRSQLEEAWESHAGPGGRV